MGALFVFVLKTSIVMLAMYLVFKALICNGRHHGFNRAVLLSVYVLAPVIAALSGKLIPDTGATPATDNAEMINTLISQANVSRAVTVTDSSQPAWPAVVIGLWLAGSIAVFLSTAVSVVRIGKLTRGCPGRRLGKVRLIISDDPGIAPFSTFRSVVISREDYREAGRMILTHELRHIRLLHTLDLILSRIAVAFAWFNPVVWLLADDIRVIHEYQADDAVIGSGADARAYQLLLIRKAAGVTDMPLACAFGQKLIRSRITMMLGKKRRADRRWCVVFMLPALALTVLASRLTPVHETIDRISGSDFLALFSPGGTFPEPVIGCTADDSVGYNAEDPEGINVVAHIKNNEVAASRETVKSTPSENDSKEIHYGMPEPAASSAEAAPDAGATLGDSGPVKITGVGTVAKDESKSLTGTLRLTGRAIVADPDMPDVPPQLTGIVDTDNATPAVVIWNEDCTEDTEIYVDGRIQADISHIRPDDIESITVRKDTESGIGRVYIRTKKNTADRIESDR